MSGIIQTSEYKTKFTRDDLTLPNKVLLITPSSTGFTFTGWKLGNDYKDIFSILEHDNKYYLTVSSQEKFNKKELGATIDLYAKWEAKNVDVTIEIWGESINSTGKYKEKPNSDGVVEVDTCTYELVFSFKVNDFKSLEENVTLSKIRDKIPNSFTTNGFKLKKFSKNDDNELVYIKPDSSTVVKFYYYREEYKASVADTIKGGYLNKSDVIKLKRIFKKNNPSVWKSILSTSSVDPDFDEYFIVKYGQTIKQEAEFIKNLNLDSNEYGKLTLECYSLPTNTIQSKSVEHSNIDFNFEYERKEFPITLNLNGYGYFGDISNPTYSITSTVQANTKADSVLGIGNFKYKTYWVYNDNIFHIPNNDEIITGPKVYNLEKRPNVDESQIWREFNVTSYLHEDNGIDLVYDESSKKDKLDIDTSDIINSQLFYESNNNNRRTDFNKLKKINLPNTKLKNYWLTNLNIKVNNSFTQPTTLKDLNIEYFEKNIPNDANISSIPIIFVPFVERLEPDISGTITLSNITSNEFTVNGINTKDGASHVLVSLNNLNYEKYSKNFFRL